MNPASLVPLRVGISTCLLGQRVRHDGGHKKDRFLTETFGRYVEWVPVCPEVEVGMETPREPIRLQRDGKEIRLVTINTGIDHTSPMRAFAKKRADQLAQMHLCGYVLKKGSPSCGMQRVKVYDHNGSPSEYGVGMFAQALMQRLPHLPVEEEGRLCDPRLRESFIERVFAYHRLRQLFAPRWKIGDLVAFHTAHKLQLLSHSPQAYRQLGRFVSGAKRLPRGKVRDSYEARFMRVLAKAATPRRHVNVMQHIAGYFKKQLDGQSRQELQGLIEDYRNGLVPLVVPVALLRHHVGRFNVADLQGQTFLEPHPNELMLRNHV